LPREVLIICPSGRGYRCLKIRQLRDSRATGDPSMIAPLAECP
jgi:hypothetical protein